MVDEILVDNVKSGYSCLRISWPSGNGIWTVSYIVFSRYSQHSDRSRPSSKKAAMQSCFFDPCWYMRIVTCIFQTQVENGKV